ncbi:glycosyl hydrolases family 31-domain-containing protein, partial [Scenedesmus sp. NREL 46B-D3]
MDRFRDFTLDPVRFPVNAMREFVASLHAAGQRWVPIIDCGIPVAQDDAAYQEGIAAGVFVKDLSGKPYVGQVWPGATHYPDFTSVTKTWPWWQRQLQRMYSQVQFDGIWIDMNEPSNFCTGEVCSLHADSRLHKLLGGIKAITIGSGAGKPHEASHGYLDQELDQLKEITTCHLDCTQARNGSSGIAYPPYSIAHGVRGTIKRPYALGKKIIAMSASGVDGELLYDTHNIYGLSEAAATHSALENILGKRPFILTRSTFPGSGKFAAHWSGDNNATWAGLRQSVHSLLASSMWGMPLAGSDICGFLGNSTEELCARWMSAGAFYTFSRNHNSLYSSPQEPYLWPSVAAAARKALAMKYRLLPHLYSWFYRAHVRGGAVAQPLFFAFPADLAARNVADQWLLGDSVLVSPVLTEGKRSRQAYFPPGKWYDLWDQTLTLQGPKTQTLEAPIGDIPLHLRGGSVLSLQQPASTTAAVRESPLTLLLALDKSGSEGSTGQELQGSTTLQERCSTVVPADALMAAQGAGSSSSTMQLVGCGLLYMDAGDSIEVPDVRGGYLLLHFTAAASKDFSAGWLRATPTAAAGAGRSNDDAQSGSSLHDVPKVEEVLILGLSIAHPVAGAGAGKQRGHPSNTRRLQAAAAAAAAAAEAGGASSRELLSRPGS